MKRCKKCVLPDTYPNIIFDYEGVCNYCLDTDHNTPLGESALLEVIDRDRNRTGKYDCLLGLSGGRDSAYALYYAVSVMGLNPLTFTVDNGFLPSTTHENIANATRILGIDHVYVQHDFSKKCLPKVLSSWMKRPSVPMISFMCLGCRLGMANAFNDLSNTYGQRLLITGGGEPVRIAASMFFTHHSRGWKRPVDMAYNICMEYVKNFRYIIDPQLLYTMVRQNFHQFPLALQLFEYLPYDESEIMKVIQNELKWKKWGESRSAWRSDCKIGILKSYLYLKTVGFSKLDDLLSGLIRSGSMNREEGLTRLSQENFLNEKYIEEFVKELGVNYTALCKII